MPKRTNLIHELASRENRHRIIVLYDNGTNAYGSWHPQSEVASFEELRACADPAHQLPMGIFTVKEQPAQILGV